VTPARPPRVLICEDSRTYAAALKRMFEHGGAFDVVGISTTAEDAIAALPRLQPDLVTMDIELPGMSGLEAVEEIMSVRPLPILVLSGHVNANTENAAAALAAGALEAFAKDDLDLRDPDGAAAAAFRRRAAVLSRARVIRHPRGRLKRRSAATAGARTASVVGICASTGGPQVLASLLASLPAQYPIPVLVVQHISAGFTEGLAQWLDRTTRIPVHIAEDGAELERGVWIAPEGAHLKLEASGKLALDRRTVRGHHRPSGDILFESMAAAAGDSAVAVVLTGMGRDGAAGAAAVRARGGLAIAQTEASSAVYGMPKEAAARGADLLSPEEIGNLLVNLRPERLA
jgi:two-component system, chemotaxis family, protein-glutamate methylesterase/glutaminase